MKLGKYQVLSGLLVLASWYVGSKKEEEDIREAVSEELDNRGLSKPRETQS